MRAGRLLLLLQKLHSSRRPVTAARLADILDVSERTIYRDVATLLAHGAPIAGEAGIGYVLEPGLFLPPLMFGDDETEAIFLGLQYVAQCGDGALAEAASAASAKIESAMPPSTRAAWSVPLSIPGPPSEQLPANAVSLFRLRMAIRHQKCLAIQYSDAAGEVSARVIWPVQLAFLDRARLLIAWCDMRQDFRTFRTDRIIAAAEGDRYPARRFELLRRYAARPRRPAPDRI